MGALRPRGQRGRGPKRSRRPAVSARPALFVRVTLAMLTVTVRRPDRVPAGASVTLTAVGDAAVTVSWGYCLLHRFLRTPTAQPQDVVESQPHAGSLTAQGPASRNKPPRVSVHLGEKEGAG